MRKTSAAAAIRIGLILAAVVVFVLMRPPRATHRSPPPRNAPEFASGQLETKTKATNGQGPNKSVSPNPRALTREQVRALLKDLKDLGFRSDQAKEQRLSEQLARLLHDGFALRDLLAAFIEEGGLGPGLEVLKQLLSDHRYQGLLVEVVGSNGDEELRLLAVRLIGSFTSLTEAQRDILLRTASQESSGSVKRELIALAGDEVNNPSVIKAVSSMFDDSLATNSEILGLLARSRCPEARLKLREFLESESISDAFKSCVVLAMSNSRLIHVEAPDYAWVRPILLSVVRKATSEPIPKETLALYATVTEAISESGDNDAATSLVDALTVAPQSETKYFAARGLRNFPRNDVRLALLDAAKTKSYSVSLRKAALESLSRMTTPDIVISLRSIAQDPETPSEISSLIEKLLEGK